MFSGTGFFKSIVICVLFCSGLKARPSLGRLYYRFSETCEPPRGDVCVEIRKCPYFAQLLDENPIPRPRNVIEVIKEHHCGLQNNAPKVCCFMPTTPQPTRTTSNYRRTTTIPMTFPTKNIQYTSTRYSDIFEKLDKQSIRNHPNFGLLPTETCGQISTSFRITGGTKVDIEEFPWMALIAYFTKNGFDFRCGGTVINENYVLTAAHCILNSTTVGVRLGEFNISDQKDCNADYCSPPVQDFYIENVILHPNYNPKTFENDIALIKLATKANFTYSNVRPICLPVDELNDDIIGKFALVSGWGVTDDGYKSSVMMKASVPVLPIANCRKLYSKFAPITENQICAGGYQGRDSCSGDSGGPMKYVGLIDGSPRYIQYGIVSFGPRHCGTEGQPGVYTRVANYLNWILDNIKP